MCVGYCHCWQNVRFCFALCSLDERLLELFSPTRKFYIKENNMPKSENLTPRVMPKNMPLFKISVPYRKTARVRLNLQNNSFGGDGFWVGGWGEGWKCAGLNVGCLIKWSTCLNAASKSHWPRELPVLYLKERLLKWENLNEIKSNPGPKHQVPYLDAKRDWLALRLTCILKKKNTVVGTNMLLLFERSPPIVYWFYTFTLF